MSFRSNTKARLESDSRRDPADAGAWVYGQGTKSLQKCGIQDTEENATMKGIATSACRDLAAKTVGAKA
jgi:hypothetical protein